MLSIIAPLIAIFTLSLGAFVYAGVAFRGCIEASTLARWRNLFLAVTVIGFVTPNYWLMLAAVAVAVTALGVGEKFKPALYLLLLFALPAVDAVVPGFAGINNFLRLFPFNVLAIVILFPVLIAGSRLKLAKIHGGLPDYFFFSFSALVLVLAFRDTTMTDGLRRFTDYFLTAAAQYLVFSRINWTLDRLKLATIALVTPLMALSAIGVAEVVLHWHLYDAMVDRWNINYIGRYLERSGLLRSYGSVFGPISFGLFFVVGISLIPALIQSTKSKALPRLGLLALLTGLLTTFSRGPWIGGAISFAARAATTARPVSNLMRLSMIGLVLTPILALTPFGGKLIDLLPFIGSVESNTIDYRQQLLQTGWDVVMKNPLFGSTAYIDTAEMQSLIQGQGIIDIVNSYLRTALDYGLVGLSLFVGVQFFALYGLFRALPAARRMPFEYSVYCQSYLAALFSVLIVIATTSSLVAQVQEVIWVLCGICVGLTRTIASTQTAGDAAPAPTDDASSNNPPITGRKPKRTTVLPPHLRQYDKNRP